MKKRYPISMRLRKAFTLSAVLFTALIVSCKKEGLLTPAYNSSQFELKDTILTLTSSTVSGDSLKAYDQLLGAYSYNVLGELRDETFGTVKSDIYTRLYLSTLYIDPPNPIVAIDSTVMQICWREFYGFTSEMEITVNELGEALNPNQDYYTNDSISVKQQLGVGTMRVSENDTFPDSLYVCRIRLSDDLGERIIEKQKFANQQAWLDFFNGIHISAKLINPSAQSGAIGYMVLGNPAFHLKVYYRDSNGESSSYPFTAVSVEDKLGTRFSTFKNYPAPALTQNIAEGTAATYNYLATLSGPRVKLQINDIEKLAALSPLSVNKAELIIPYEDPAIPQYEPAYGIFIRQENSDGTYSNLLDYQNVSDDDYFGGYQDETAKEYRFNIARTMNSVVNRGQTDLNMFLVTRGSAVTANRFSINSGVHPTKPIYILMTYTKQL